MTRRIYVIAALLCGLVLGVWGDRAGAQVQPHLSRSVYQLQRFMGTDAYNHIIARNCGAGEDSWAHVHFIRVEDGTVYLRCATKGY